MEQNLIGVYLWDSECQTVVFVSLEDYTKQHEDHHKDLEKAIRRCEYCAEQPYIQEQQKSESNSRFFFCFYILFC